MESGQPPAAVADGGELEDGPGRPVELGGPLVLHVLGDALDGEDRGAGLLGELAELAHDVDRVALAGHADVAGERVEDDQGGLELGDVVLVDLAVDGPDLA